jgi:hypothetical protein
MINLIKKSKLKFSRNIFLLLAITVSLSFIYGCSSNKTISCEAANTENIKICSNESYEAVKIKPKITIQPYDKNKIENNYKKNKKLVFTPGVTEDMQTPDFWINKIDNPNELIMTQEQIQEFNNKIIKNVDSMYNLYDYKDTLNKKELLRYINYYKKPTRIMYNSNGKPINDNFYNSISNNLNLDKVKDKNPVRYGITIKKTSLRSFPTDEPVYKKARNDRFDRFQETACQACELVLILHESKDSKWFFVQTNNYRGWAKAENIALVENKKQALDYISSKQFITVTNDYIALKLSIENDKDTEFKYYMGTVIPITSENDFGYIIRIPIKNKNGSLEYKETFINRNSGVNKGYLKYTRANIIKQAFKLLGSAYSWGDKEDGSDCSSFLMNLYKTFGINIPRNTDQQEKSPNKLIQFNSNNSLTQRISMLNNAKPGTEILMNGHAMMYLGKHNNTHYMIHNFAGYGKKVGNTYNFVPVYQVAITSVDLPASSGTPFVKRFTSVIQFEN